MMKIRALILLAIFTVLASCGSDDLELDDCRIVISNQLNALEIDYNTAIALPDSEGNSMSLEACLNRRQYTEDYKEVLINTRAELSLSNCSDADLILLLERIDNRIEELEQDLVNVWSTCEEDYGRIIEG